MKKKEVADAIRLHLTLKELLPTDILEERSDDEIIEAFITCPDCDEKTIDDETLAEIIRDSKTIEGFFALIEVLTSEHFEVEPTDPTIIKLGPKKWKKPKHIISINFYISASAIEDAEDEKEDDEDELDDGEPPGERVTITIIQPKTGEMVEQWEHWFTEEEGTKPLDEQMGEIPTKYPNSVLLVSPPEILESCDCSDCCGFLTSYFNEEDYINLLQRMAESE